MGASFPGLTGARYHVGPALPIRLPEGALSARVRQRINDFVRLFVRYPARVEHYIAREVDGEWIADPEFLQGINQKTNGPQPST